MVEPNDPRVILAGERTRLATQRTVLSWNRTALAFMAFGVALARFSLFAELFVAQSRSMEGMREHQIDPALTTAVGAGLVVLGGVHALIGLALSRGTAQKSSSRELLTSRVSAGGTLIAACALLYYLLGM